MSNGKSPSKALFDDKKLQKDLKQDVPFARDCGSQAEGATASCGGLPGAAWASLALALRSVQGQQEGPGRPVC